MQYWFGGMFRDLRFLMGQFIIRGKTFHTCTGSVNLANLWLYQTDNCGDNINTIRDIAIADSYFLWNFYIFDFVFALLYDFYLICYMNSIYIWFVLCFDFLTSSSIIKSINSTGLNLSPSAIDCVWLNTVAADNLELIPPNHFGVKNQRVIHISVFFMWCSHRSNSSAKGSSWESKDFVKIKQKQGSKYQTHFFSREPLLCSTQNNEVTHEKLTAVRPYNLMVISRNHFDIFLRLLNETLADWPFPFLISHQ